MLANRVDIAGIMFLGTSPSPLLAVFMDGEGRTVPTVYVPAIWCSLILIIFLTDVFIYKHCENTVINKSYNIKYILTATL